MLSVPAQLLSVPEIDYNARVSKPSTPEHFWSRTIQDGPCRLWIGAQNGNGYGTLDYQGKRVSAHRLAWFLHHGWWPWPGTIVMHLCDRPLCVERLHLALGTQQDNMDWMKRRGRHKGTTGLHVNVGERHGNSRFTEELVLEIRALWASGQSQHAISTKYGLAPTTVRHLVRDRWLHLPLAAKCSRQV